MDTITKYQINLKLLYFEITKSIMMNPFTYIIDIMNKIIALGIGFSIDDFGIGYVSFGYKVSIVNNVVKFAKELQLNIVAEGVEELE